MPDQRCRLAAVQPEKQQSGVQTEQRNNGRLRRSEAFLRSAHPLQGP